MDKIKIIKEKINNIDTKYLFLIDKHLDNILDELDEIDYINNMNTDEINNKIILEINNYKEQKEFINKFLPLIIYLNYIQ